MNQRLLYIVIVLMQFVVLTNVTLFHSKWNGFMMFICTGLFILGTYFYLKGTGKLDPHDD
ncbi:hypothetical protein ACIQ4I_08910 [Rummeliibacillus sp. NPDC094406]|uniref:hypothetical protein n=1 Tax=Rummeliibacillus sp. NPDC094406 TaxID=3364511 RepID=UPI0038032401